MKEEINEIDQIKKINDLELIINAYKNENTALKKQIELLVNRIDLLKEDNYYLTLEIKELTNTLQVVYMKNEIKDEY